MVNSKVHNPGHPCRAPPKQSMIVCNYGDRIRNARDMNTFANLARVVSTSVYLNGDITGFATKDGEPICFAVPKEGAVPLISENGLIGYPETTNVTNPNPPEVQDATELGALVARNTFSHLAGPLVKDNQGKFNYNLMLRGYNKNGVQVSREKDNYMGLDLWHDGTDAYLGLSSGSDTTVTDAGTPQELTTINYEKGETVRLRMSGTATALADRTLTFEKRTSDSTQGGPAATWTPWFRLQ